MAHTAVTKEEEKEFLDDEASLDQKVTQLAEWILNANHFIAFTGAGISTGAGIPDFRSGADTITGMGAGKWAHQAMKKRNDPRLKSGKKPKNKATASLKAIPTPTHMMLVRLAELGHLKALISQNTDGLHRRSGFPVEPLEESPMLNRFCELHGNTTIEQCAKCHHEYMRDFRCRKRGLKAKNHKTGRKCTRPGCGGALLDSIINFGEDLPEKDMEDGFTHSEVADLCLVMGSSLRVSPACNMPERVGDRGQTAFLTEDPNPPRLVICNLQETPYDGMAAMRIGGKCDKISRLLMEKLKIEIPGFRLQRFIKFEQSVAADKCVELLVRAVDNRGVPHDLFTNATAQAPPSGVICCAGTAVRFRGVGSKFKFPLGKKPNKVHLEFHGNYNEPKLILDVPKEDEATLLLSYDPSTREWAAPEQVEIEDRDVGTLMVHRPQASPKKKPAPEKNL